MTRARWFALLGVYLACGLGALALIDSHEGAFWVAAALVAAPSLLLGWASAAGALFPAITVPLALLPLGALFGETDYSPRGGDGPFPVSGAAFGLAIISAALVLGAGIIRSHRDRTARPARR